MLGTVLTLSPQIAEMCAYVKLLEHDNIDGMILLSELPRQRSAITQYMVASRYQ